MTWEPPLTANLLEALRLCPLKYRLYRLGDPEAGITRRVDAARALHAAVRHCLDECYRRGGPAVCPLDRLLQEFRSCFDGRACADSREEEQYHATGVRLLTEYHADHLTDCVESWQADVTSEGTIGDARFRARADRREGRPDGSIAYVLYSTSRRTPTPGPLRDDLPSGVLQLLAEQVEGRPVEVEVHVLRQRRVIDATKTPEALAGIEEQVSLLVRRARALSDPPALKGRHCRWCHARGVCPQWVRR